MNEKEQARGLFWCSLLRPLIEGETEDGDALRWLREIAAREHVFPDGQRRKVSVNGNVAPPRRPRRTPICTQTRNSRSGSTLGN